MDSNLEHLKRLVAARLSMRARRDSDLALALVPGLTGEGATQTLDKSQRIALLERALREATDRVIAAEKLAGRVDPDKIVVEMLDDIVGLGPLEALLRDENVEDIYVFGYDRVLVKPPRSNRVRPVPIRFRSEEHLRNLVYRILAQVNRRLDETSPIVDTRLPDTDHRINITIPPVSAGPWYITIRKHQESWDWVKMVEEGTADFRVLALLALAVRGGVNVLVSGATGAGKTTLLNVLGRFIPAEERVVTIEDTEELQLEEGNGGAPGRHRIQHNSELELDLRGQRNIASLLTRPAAPGQTSPVTLRDLVVASLRLSPKRIIVGEVRGHEAFDMLQALNTGHDGSICTIHASTAEQAIARLRGMLRMSGLASAGDSELDEYIGRALHLVVHTRQMADGARRVSEVRWLHLAQTDGGERRFETIPLVLNNGAAMGEAVEDASLMIEPGTARPALSRFLESPDIAERLNRNRRPVAFTITSGGDNGNETVVQTDEVSLLSSLASRRSDGDITLDELRHLILVLNNDTLEEESALNPEAGAAPSLGALFREEAAESRLIQWMNDTEPVPGSGFVTSVERRRLGRGTLNLLANLRRRPSVTFRRTQRLKHAISGGAPGSEATR